MPARDVEIRRLLISIAYMCKAASGTDKPTRRSYSSSTYVALKLATQGGTGKACNPHKSCPIETKAVTGATYPRIKPPI